MGVTKQEVRKRFVPSYPVDASAMAEGDNGFDRFTEWAKRCVLAAQEEARDARNDTMTVGHLALGLLAEPTASPPDCWWRRVAPKATCESQSKPRSRNRPGRCRR